MPSIDELLCSEAVERREPDIDLDPTLNTKATSRQCNMPDCHKTAKRGGRCIAHGGGNKCTIEGCNTSVVSRGLCVAHGGGKRCQTLGCTKSAQSGGSCWVHGGGKKCGYDGCSKRAQSGGACIAHGGGKRCRVEKCNKVVQYDGLCVGHGGYRRCAHANCDRRAMANNYCQQHGGSSTCHVQHCYKRAVRGGMCSRHKAEASWQTARGRESRDEDSDQCGTIETPLWQPRSSLDEATIKSPHEPCSPNPFDQPYESIVAQSFLPVRSSLMNQRTRNDAPRAPGFLALLSADTQTATCSLGDIAPSQSVTERFNRLRAGEPQPQSTVLPVLPSIYALQRYCSRGATMEKGPCIVLESSVTTPPFGSDHRVMVAQARTSDLNNRRGDGYNNYEDACHYFKNQSGVLPFQTPIISRRI